MLWVSVPVNFSVTADIQQGYVLIIAPSVKIIRGLWPTTSARFPLIFPVRA
ncbi:MAG: hypothetical protein P4L55_17395 [Syntrophobacteraceae bacterium]|nr:hypothetical protein [Syntrophobacteraceae bacterium]